MTIVLGHILQGVLVIASFTLVTVITLAALCEPVRPRPRRAVDGLNDPDD